MKFTLGDKIDYYTFNMNMKTRKEKRSQSKLQAKRVSLKYIADEEQAASGGKPRGLIVYPHDTHLILVEVLPNAGEVYDEDEYCVKFVLEYRLIFGISSSINYRGLKKGRAADGSSTKKDNKVFDEQSSEFMDFFESTYCPDVGIEAKNLVQIDYFERKEEKFKGFGSFSMG